MKNFKLGILASGEELLQGRLVDTNSSWIATFFKNIGFDNRMISIAGDNLPEIKKMLDLSIQKFENQLTIITGGLGPTKDDLTRDAIASYFNEPLVFNFIAINSMANFYRKVKREIKDVPLSNWVQCQFPKNSICIPNENGTAPGIWYEKNGQAIVCLPGVPHEMMPMIESLPALFPSFFGTYKPHQTELITISGVPESHVGEVLSEFMNSGSRYEVGITAKKGYIQISVSGYDETINKSIKNEILNLVKDWVVSDTGLLPQQELIAISKKNNWMIGCVESCTGGLIADAFISEPGASEVFIVGAVTYSNQSKISVANVNASTIEQFGAVSEETVKEMAANFAKISNLDICLATSGIAGPDGGSAERPVGLVWMSAYILGNTISFHKIFKGDRSSVRVRSVYTLISEVVRYLIKNK